MVPLPSVIISEVTRSPLWRSVSAPTPGSLSEISRKHPRDTPPAAATGSDGRSSPGEKKRNTSTPAKGGGPLPCITFEVLRCTTLEEVEGLIARTLGVEREGIRLWVISQPFTDGPLAPRQLLRCGMRYACVKFSWGGHWGPFGYSLAQGNIYGSTLKQKKVLGYRAGSVAHTLAASFGRCHGADDR